MPALIKNLNWKEASDELDKQMQILKGIALAWIAPIPEIPEPPEIKPGRPIKLK